MNKTNDFKFNLPAYSDPVDVEDLNDNFRGIDDALMAGLCKKDYTGNNMGSSDPSARKYAWAPWLEIVNDNEFDVVVTDRNAPVGSEEATINIAAGQTFRKYINGRYYMNFYVQDQHDVTFKWFTNAETYINESGGGGGGTGTVTSVSVQGGSGSHLTGSGNPIETSGIITINVDEGYSIPSDNEQTAWDGKAADLKFEINSSTFVITAQLKDSSGNLIGNERTIDLPLESVVVSGDYDEQTKKVILTLQNGSTIEFSVADLVSGLQTELSASNKLDPAYIDYDSSHRAVSDTEKDTWNGKQNALTFDDTPTQNSNNPVKSGGIYTALAGKQASLDSTQLAAVNSGIDSSKVAQISTNQTNILSVANRTGKNRLPFFGLDTVKSLNTAGSWSNNAYTYKNVTFTVNADGTISVSGTLASGETSAIFWLFGVNQKVLFKDLGAGNILNGCPSGGGNQTYGLMLEMTELPYSGVAYDFSNHPAITPAAATKDGSTIGCYIVVSTHSAVNLVFKPMVNEPDMYALDTSYVPYALPNYDLTRLEAEDRAALAEEIDAGVKSLVPLTWTNADPFPDIHLTKNNDGSVTVKATNTAATRIITLGNDINYHLTVGKKYVLSGCNGGYYDTTYGFALSTSNFTGKVFEADGSTEFTYTSNDVINFTLVVRAGQTWTKTFYPMICTKATFGVSQKFVPYRKGYAPVYDSYTFNTSKSYTLDSKGVGHILTISSFAHFYIGYVIQYTNEDYLRIIEIFKTTDFDNVATISSSSNVLTITAASSAHWLVTNLIKLGG